MSEKTKNVLLGVLIVGLVSMTVAYAALSQTLTINGSAKVQQASTSWNVHFTTEDDNSKEAIEYLGYATLTNSSDSLNVQATTVTAPDVTLKAPGDKVSFYFDVINDGQINAVLSGLPTNVTSTGILSGYTVEYAEANTDTDAATVLSDLRGDLEVKLTYADGTAIAANDALYGTLSSNTPARRDLVLTIEYKKDDNRVQKLPTKPVNITGITSTLTYVQANAN